MRIIPFYINPKGYINSQVNIIKGRINKSNYKHLLFIKQQGICSYCNTHLALTEYNPNGILDLDNQTEIHHVRSIAISMAAGFRNHVQSNKLENLQLLHKDCLFEIHQRA